MKEKRPLSDKLFSFLRLIYSQLFRINDTPQKIALGFGLGVFMGIVPATGPIAALFLALSFKVNRASALLGSLVTNTWLSILTFLLAVKIGAGIFRLDWQQLYQTVNSLMHNFRWNDLLKLSILNTLLPIFTGYMAVGLCCSILAYLTVYMLLITTAKKKKI